MMPANRKTEDDNTRCSAYVCNVRRNNPFPILTGLDISTTLLMAGLGTLLFHCITKFKVPAFLGSSFAFWAVMPQSRLFHPMTLTVCSRMRALALRVRSYLFYPCRSYQGGGH